MPKDVPRDEPTFEQAYQQVDQHVITLHAAWKLVRQLFATDQERVELLNRNIPFFARTVQDLLLNGLTLRITRLCEPEDMQGGRRRNLTLSRLFALLPPTFPDSVRDDLAKRLGVLQVLYLPFREHRNKRIAHADLEQALGLGEALPGVSSKLIEDVLLAIREFMNIINHHLLGGETLYEDPQAHGDGDTLIICLQQAEKLSRLSREARIGRMTPQEIASALMERT